MQLELGFQSVRGPLLRLCDSADAAWDGVIADWFARAGATAFIETVPCVVIVPTRSHAQAIRQRLLASGRSTLGVQFLTPPYLRELLHIDIGRTAGRREDLRLLLAVAAEEQSANEGLAEHEQLAATSVRRTPDHLLRLLDELSAAGWPFDAIGADAFRTIERRFAQHLASCDLRLPADADRAARDAAQSPTPKFAHLLVSGFHGAHWPLWNLLRAAVSAAGDATVLLPFPRIGAEELDSAWVGSWEEAFGDAAPAEAACTPQEHARESLFVVGLDAHEQAAAIVAVAQKFLSDERCTRLGIACPAHDALSRLVASGLTRAGIPHHDTLGQLLPGVFETASFAAWMELQRTPRLNVLLRFLESLEHRHPLFDQISRVRLESSLRNALGEIAIDDLAILMTHARSDVRDGAKVGAALDGIRFLPARATVSEFLAATEEAFTNLGWDERWREITRRTDAIQKLSATFSRTLFLRWLADVAVTFRVTRDAVGSHPYARVQLLTAAQAEDQTWSHLILAGLNEGSWPAAVRGDFLPADQIRTFNSNAQLLNRAATKRGRQGEGHIAVREGRALFLGAQQQRDLANAQFSALLESTSVAVALAASLIQEGAPERISNPSEFFSRVYYEHCETPVSQATMRALRESTRRWLDAAFPRRTSDAEESTDVTQTRVAYLARRAIERSGEYDFALTRAPNEIKPMSVSDIEALLKSPALIWMKRYLGVQGTEDSTYAWNATVGKWTHEWLASIGGKTGGFVAFPSEEQITRNIIAAAERKRAAITGLCRSAGKDLPDWWQSGWENALCLARSLGKLLATAKDWSWAVTEWKLDAQRIAVAEGATLLLRGRADLLLTRGATEPDSLAVPELWIIDFKTGHKKFPRFLAKEALDVRQRRAAKLVLKREALQLALYALAARALGAREVHVSLLCPVNRNAEPQLRLADFDGCTPIFTELARMQETAVFGMRGEVRGQFSFTGNYPLATVAVDKDVLEARWEKTHPALVDEESY